MVKGIRVFQAQETMCAGNRALEVMEHSRNRNFCLENREKIEVTKVQLLSLNIRES